MARKESCPHCGSTAIDPGKSYQCYGCGKDFWPIDLVVEDDTPVHDVPPNELVCPRCEVKLFEAQEMDILLRGCGTCGGVWLDEAASKKLFAGLRQNAIALVARADRIPLPDDGGGATTRRCPIDRVPLERRVEHGVDVDACPRHGAFFDAGEIQLIVTVCERDRRLARAPGDAPPALLGAVYRAMGERG